MGFFTEIGYARLAAERKARFIREGRYGESLGFVNRPDLNDPWSEDARPLSWQEWLLALSFLGGWAIFLTVFIWWTSKHPL